MTEAYTSLPNNLRYYGEVNENGEVVRYGSQIPFNFDFLMGTNKYTKAGEYKDRIEEWVNGLPKGKGIHANWVVSKLKKNWNRLQMQSFLLFSSWEIMIKNDWPRDLDLNASIY